MAKSKSILADTFFSHNLMVQIMGEMELCSLLVTRVQPLESTVSNATNSSINQLYYKLYTANEVFAGRQVCEKYLANGTDVF